MNQDNGFGRTALHAAAKGSFVRVIEVLLRNGADVHALDADGATPLDLTRTARRAQAETLLLAAGEA